MAGQWPQSANGIAILHGWCSQNIRHRTALDAAAIRVAEHRGAGEVVAVAECESRVITTGIRL